jgi:membrane-associated phospholipid phosphatase
VLPVAGLLALVVAAGICVAAVVGRYHYAVDVLAGVVLVLGIFVALG